MSTPLAAPIASSRGRREPAGTGPSGRGGRRPAPPQRPDRVPHALAIAAAILLSEVDAGRRTLAQLRPMMTPLLKARLAALPPRRPARQAARVLRVRATRSTAERYEAVAVLQRGPRAGAVLLSLVRTPFGWRLDDLTCPEIGPLPPPAFPVPTDCPDSFDLVDA